MRLFLSMLSVCFTCVCSIIDVYGQQDPQYTQYMYNTMTVNPAYAGSKDHAVIIALARTQWHGIDGAPNTQTLSYDTPLMYRLGLGVNLVNDKIGPSHETYLDINTSYTLEVGAESNLAFGLKLGGRLLNIDWSLGKSVVDDPIYTSETNIVNKFLPTVGAGIYYHEYNWYVGLAVPNFLGTEHYDEVLAGNYKAATERSHMFFIAGSVFDITEYVKFKPSTLLKVVAGAPVSVDISANFLFNERFRAGLAWRWNDSLAALLGFQVSESLNIGYSYDRIRSNYKVVNTGIHEVMLRYEIFKESRVRPPRFF